MSNNLPPSDGFLSKDSVRYLLGGDHPLGRSTINKYVKAGIIPKPFYLSPRKPVWRRADIVACVEKQAEANISTLKVKGEKHEQI